MQQLNPSEISEIIKDKIDKLDVKSEARNEGTVVSVTDGIIRIHGLAEAMYGEMIEFEGGIYGLALNLERDSVGAVILGDRMSNDLMEASYKAEEFPHGFTAGGHPVGCALALEAIDIIINEKMIENVQRLEPIFMGGLKQFEEFEFIGEARGIGLMGALEMVHDKKTKTPFDGSVSIGERVANQCIENGLICRPLGPSIVLCPPFITTDDEMGIIFETLDKTLKKVFSEVKSLG